jgi:23S rRNA pseudouridine1911/1915/1917 synthase
VLLDGAVCQETGHAVSDSARIEWDPNRRAMARPHRVSCPFPVLYQDDQVLVVDKPPGVLSVPAPGAGEEKSVLGELLEALRPRVQDRRTFVGRVHRLDRDTSGALVFALTPESRAGLIDLFREHKIERRYVALVAGEPPQDEGRIEAPIADSYDSGRRRLARGDEPQSPAFTRYKVRERMAGAALLEVSILTGRQHQIRLHLAHVGLPVIGDRVYGPRGAKAPPVEARRQMLHAETLGFAHPLTGKAVRVTSPLPEDMRRALTRLRRRPRVASRETGRPPAPEAPAQTGRRHAVGAGARKSRRAR